MRPVRLAGPEVSSRKRRRIAEDLAALGGMRNPAAAPKMFGNVLLGFALTEAVALYALVMAFLIMFG